MPTSETVPLRASNDNRLLIAGVVGFAALIVYLAVAFARTHPGPVAVNPWVPTNDANLVSVSLGKGRGFLIHVTPPQGAPAQTAYGAYIPTLVPAPSPGSTFVVGLRLRGSRAGGPLGVQIHVFRPGTASRYLVDTTVPVRPRWRRFTFKGRVKGSWVGLSINVYRQTNGRGRPWFAIRGLTTTFPPH